MVTFDVEIFFPRRAEQGCSQLFLLGGPVGRDTNKRVLYVAVQQALWQFESLLFCTAINHWTYKCRKRDWVFTR